MSYLSDPDRLERQAMYVSRGEAIPREVAEALTDAAERMRRTEGQLSALTRRLATDHRVAFARTALDDVWAPSRQRQAEQPSVVLDGEAKAHFTIGYLTGVIKNLLDVIDQADVINEADE